MQYGYRMRAQLVTQSELIITTLCPQVAAGKAKPQRGLIVVGFQMGALQTVCLEMARSLEVTMNRNNVSFSPAFASRKRPNPHNMVTFWNVNFSALWYLIDNLDNRPLVFLNSQSTRCCFYFRLQHPSSP